MSYIYTAEDYGTADVPGRVDTFYRRYPFFDRDRAPLLESRFSGAKSQTVLVAGSGPGYLVDALRLVGFTDVWGFDASQVALEMAAERLPDVSDRILLADATVAGDVQAVRQQIGRPRLIVDEDLLSCASSEAEAAAMLANLREILHPQGRMVHVLTMRSETVPHMAGAEQVSGFLWLSPAEWRSIIGDETIFVAGPLSEAA